MDKIGVAYTEHNAPSFFPGELLCARWRHGAPTQIHPKGHVEYDIEVGEPLMVVDSQPLGSRSKALVLSRYGLVYVTKLYCEKYEVWRPLRLYRDSKRMEKMLP